MIRVVVRRFPGERSHARCRTVGTGLPLRRVTRHALDGPLLPALGGLRRLLPGPCGAAGRHRPDGMRAVPGAWKNGGASLSSPMCTSSRTRGPSARPGPRGQPLVLIGHSLVRPLTKRTRAGLLGGGRRGPRSPEGLADLADAVEPADQASRRAAGTAAACDGCRRPAGRPGEDQVARAAAGRPRRAGPPGRRNGKIISLVRPCWTLSPSSRTRRRCRRGPAARRGSPATGPVGPKPGCDLPSENCGGVAGQLEHALGEVLPHGEPGDGVPGLARAGSGWPPRPMTATTSISQSTLPVGQLDRASTGPAMQLGNLVKTRADLGRRRSPASAACGGSSARSRRPGAGAGPARPSGASGTRRAADQSALAAQARTSSQSLEDRPWGRRAKRRRRRRRRRRPRRPRVTRTARSDRVDRAHLLAVSVVGE